MAYPRLGCLVLTSQFYCLALSECLLFSVQPGARSSTTVADWRRLRACRRSSPGNAGDFGRCHHPGLRDGPAWSSFARYCLWRPSESRSSAPRPPAPGQCGRRTPAGLGAVDAARARCAASPGRWVGLSLGLVNHILGQAVQQVSLPADFVEYPAGLGRIGLGRPAQRDCLGSPDGVQGCLQVI